MTLVWEQMLKYNNLLLTAEWNFSEGFESDPTQNGGEERQGFEVCSSAVLRHRYVACQEQGDFP